MQRMLAHYGARVHVLRVYARIPVAAKGNPKQ